MKFRISYERAIIGAAVVLLLLLLFLFPYSHPHTDDFSYNQFLSQKGYWAATKYVFTHNGGRFLATAILFMSPLSTKHPELYPLLNAALLIGFVGSVGLCARVLFSKQKALLSAALLLLYFFSFLPNLHEFIYWLAGSATYLSAAALFMTLCALHILLTQENYRHQNIFWIGTALNTILICGCSEAGLFMASIPLGAHYLWSLKQQSARGKISGIALCWLLTTLVVVLAPGSMHRHAMTPFSGQLLLSIGGGLYASAYWLLHWILPLSSAALVYATQLAPSLVARTSVLNEHLSVKRVTVYALLFFAGCQMAAVWMSGSMPEARFENLLFLFALLCTFLIVQMRVNRQQKNIPLQIHYAIFWILIAAPFLVLPHNFSKATRDLFSGNAQRFHQQNIHRFDLIENSKDDISKVPAITAQPELLYYPSLSCEAQPDTKDVPRIAMADYFGKKWIYEYPCMPEKRDNSLKAFLKQKRKDWFSHRKQ